MSGVLGLAAGRARAGRSRAAESCSTEVCDCQLLGILSVFKRDIQAGKILMIQVSW